MMRFGPVVVAGIVMWAILIAGISKCRASDDWNATVLLASNHPLSDDFDCYGVDQDYNESNPGLIIGYKHFIIGRFENSQSGCRDIEYSNLIGAQSDLGKAGPIQFSVTGGIADGYHEDDTDFGEYRAWVSLNAQLGPVKILYGYRVIAFGLAWSWE